MARPETRTVPGRPGGPAANRWELARAAGLAIRPPLERHEPHYHVGEKDGLPFYDQDVAQALARSLGGRAGRPCRCALGETFLREERDRGQEPA